MSGATSFPRPVEERRGLGAVRSSGLLVATDAQAHVAMSSSSSVPWSSSAIHFCTVHGSRRSGGRRSRRSSIASRCTTARSASARSDACGRRAGSGGIVDARDRAVAASAQRAGFAARSRPSGEAIVARRRIPTITITSPQHAAPIFDFVRTCVPLPAPSGAGYRDGWVDQVRYSAAHVPHRDVRLARRRRSRARARRAPRAAGRQLRQRLADLDHRRRSGRDRPRVAAAPGRRVPPARAICRTTTCGSRSSARCPPAPTPTRCTLGSEPRTLGSLWDGLECFAAYGDDLEPAPLAQAATDALGRAPDAAGLVDHDAIGTAWEQRPRRHLDRGDGVRRAASRHR